LRNLSCPSISAFDQFGFDKSSFLVNTFSEIEVNSPQQQLVFSGREYLVCRKKFDNYIANLALKAGAKIFFNSSFLRREKDNQIIVKENGEENDDSNYACLTFCHSWLIVPYAKR